MYLTLSGVRSNPPTDPLFQDDTVNSTVNKIVPDTMKLSGLYTKTKKR